MPNPDRTQSWPYQNTLRVAISAATGITLTILGLIFRLKFMSPLIGWDVGALTYIVWTFVTTFRLNAEETARHASAEDPARIGIDVAMILASIASLGAVVTTLIESGHAASAARNSLILIAVASVVLSWLLVYTVYTLVYAKIYYDEPKGGINFNSEEDPDYADFAYFAFTIGMTYQVSDTPVTSRRIRRTVTHQAAIAYIFGTVIIATTVNLIASLAK